MNDAPGLTGQPSHTPCCAPDGAGRERLGGAR